MKPGYEADQFKTEGVQFVGIYRSPSLTQPQTDP